MRNVKRMKSAGKAKERATEERVSMKAKEENSDVKENNTRRRRGKTKTMEKDTNWAEWRLTWRPVARAPIHIRPRKERRKERD